MLSLNLLFSVKFMIFVILYREFILIELMRLRTVAVNLYVLWNSLKTDLSQIFYRLAVHFKTIFCSLVCKCYLWENLFIKTCKSIVTFRETLFLTNFSIIKPQSATFFKNELLQNFEQIVKTEFHSLLMFSHSYQQQQLRD